MREMDNLRREYIESKRCGNLSGGKISERTEKLRIILEPTFLEKLLSTDFLTEKKMDLFVAKFGGT